MPKPIQTDFLFTSQLVLSHIPDLSIKPKRSFKLVDTLDLEEMKNDALYVFSRLIGKVEKEIKRLKKNECEVPEYDILIQEIQAELSFIEMHLMH